MTEDLTRKRSRRWLVFPGLAIIAVELVFIGPRLLKAATGTSNYAQVSNEIDSLIPLAEAGDVHSQFRLANRYFARAQKDPQDYKNVLLWETKAAENGHTTAISNLATAYIYGLYGSFTPKDLKRAFELYEKGANSKISDRGAIECMVNLANAYYNGEGVEKDPKQALHWFEKAAEAEDGRALAFLAVAYRSGETGFVARDEEKATSLAAKAIAHKTYGSEYSIGLFFEKSPDMRDRQKALPYYKQAAAQNHSEALNRLSRLYDRGNYRGIVAPIDKQASFTYALRSAKRGSAEGQMLVAIAYRDGDGTDKDTREGIKWAERSAKQGHAWGQLVYGMMLYRSTHNPVQAYPWVKRSFANIPDDAEEYVGYLQENMSQAQYEEAEDLAAIPFTATSESSQPLDAKNS